jgi:hypothetical protein
MKTFISRPSWFLAITAVFAIGLTSRGGVALAEPLPAAEGRLIRVSDEWSARLLDPQFWASMRAGGPRSLGRGDVDVGQSIFVPPRASRVPSDSGTYKTVCVRLCDGFQMPMSFSTRRDKFAAEAQKCEAACPGQGRLFVHRNPGGDVTELEDLSGVAYSKLPTAFLYKTKYDAACKCRPHPWEEASLDRHRLYALEQQQRGGNRTVIAEIKELSKKVTAAEAQVRPTGRASAERPSKSKDRTKAKVAAAVPQAVAIVDAARPARRLVSARPTQTSTRLARPMSTPLPVRLARTPVPDRLFGTTSAASPAPAAKEAAAAAILTPAARRTVRPGVVVLTLGAETWTVPVGGAASGPTVRR